jgi:predicted permease
MAAGRGFVEEEGGNRAAPVVVIADHIWRRYFGRDPRAIGKLIRVNKHELTIVGVAPPEFRGGLPGLVYDLWIPFPMLPTLGVGGSLRYRATRDGTATFARMKPGVTIEQVSQEIGGLSRRLAAAEPRTNGGIEATAVTLAGGHNGAQRILNGPLRILIVVGGLVLLIVCANVANLLLARSVTRQREFGVRLALGCSRARLIRQILTETLVLAIAGSGLGVLMSLWMRDSLNLLLPVHDVPIELSAPLDGSVLIFTIGVCILTTVFCGVAPAMFSSHLRLNEKLKEGGRSDSAASGGNSTRLRNVLIVSEVALASVALIGAALFLRSFANATSIYPGFDSRNVLATTFYLSPAGYSADQEIEFCRRLRERMSAVGEVSAVTYADQTPFNFGNHPVQKVAVEGYTPSEGEDMYIQRSLTGAGYFDVMRIPLIEGRDFTDLDKKGSERVVIVNQTFARRFWGAGRSPLGRKVWVENNWFTVVGLARDAKYNQPTEAFKPYMYLKYDQYFSRGLPTVVFARTRGNPMDLVSSLRREVLQIDPNVAAFSAMPLRESLSAEVTAQRMAAALLSALGLMALVLAAVGLYGVISYSVSRRTQELGLRMALGASPLDILHAVGRAGLTLTISGIACGMLVALLLTRLISSMLIQVSAADPLAFGGTALVLFPVAVVATLIPALRATRLNPTEALRSE